VQQVGNGDRVHAGKLPGAVVWYKAAVAVSAGAWTSLRTSLRRTVGEGSGGRKRPDRGELEERRPALGGGAGPFAMGSDSTRTIL
jgi:hypothetical protein